MRRVGWPGVLAIAGVMIGCQGKKAPPPPVQPVPTGNIAEVTREQFKRANPNVEVGTVLAVLTEKNFAAIGDIPADTVQAGDPISFLDANLNDITLGHVIGTMHGNVQVQFDVPPSGRRGPHEGDIAVHVPTGVTLQRPAPGTLPPATIPVEPTPTPPTTPATTPAPETPATAPATEPATPATEPTTAPAPETPATEPTTAPATEPAAPATEPAAPATEPAAPATEPAAPATEPATAPATEPAAPVENPNK